MAYKDLYSILGVDRSASQDEIQRVYKKLARKYHPDISKEPDAENRFKEIGQAYDVLRDEKKRALYDQYGEHWKAVSEGRAPPPGAENVKFDFGDLGVDPSQMGDLGSFFEQIFGGMAGGGAPGGFGGFGRASARGGPRGGVRWTAAGVDHEVAIELDLRDAFRGGEKELALVDSSGEQKRLKVRIPPGVRDGQRVRLSGQGGAGVGGGPAGDLYLHVELRPDPDFRLEGDDLCTALPLAPWEAALGATVAVRTLEETRRVKVPPGSSTGRRIRLREQGWPKRGGGRGDLYAEIRIEVPEELTAEERELMEKLASASKFRARPWDGGGES